MDHDLRARLLLATCQNTPTAADEAAEAEAEGHQFARYARLLSTTLAAHGGCYGSASVPASLAADLTAAFVADGYSVRRGPARTPACTTLTLYAPSSFSSLERPA